MNKNIFLSIIALIFIALGFSIGSRLGTLHGFAALAVVIAVVLVESFFEGMWTWMNKPEEPEDQRSLI